MEKTDAPDVLPVILGGDIGAYSIARAFHEAYGIVPLVLSQAACHLCGDSSILANRVVPHLERPAVLLSTLANTAECFGDRPLLLLGCGDWYVRLIVENRAVLEKSFIIPSYIKSRRAAMARRGGCSSPGLRGSFRRVSAPSAFRAARECVRS